MKPVIEVPGLTPTSPVTLPPAAQVTSDVPRIAKLAAEPSVDGPWADAGDGPKRNTANPVLANRTEYLPFILPPPFDVMDEPPTFVTVAERRKRDDT